MKNIHQTEIKRNETKWKNSRMNFINSPKLYIEKPEHGFRMTHFVEWKLLQYRLRLVTVNVVSVSCAG